MNIYFVDVGEVTTYYGEYDPPETGRLVALVRAGTKSKAQYIMWREYLRRDNGALHEFDYKTRLIAKNVVGESGDISYGPESDKWWRRVDKVLS